MLRIISSDENKPAAYLHAERQSKRLMKQFVPIAVTVLFLSFNSFGQIPSDQNLSIEINNLSETNFSGIVSNTRPDVQCEFQYKQGRTNWISLGFVIGSETTNWTAFNFRTTNAIDVKRVRIRSWQDDGSGLPLWWQLKYFGGIGVDPYGNPMDDGFNNLQKFQAGMDPFKWYQPREPEGHLTFRQGKDIQHENAVLSWMNNNGYSGPPPDFFVIERANRTLRPITNNWPPRTFIVNGRMVTNRPPPNFHPPYGFRPPYGRPGQPPQDSFVTGPFEVIASVPGQPNVRDYQYTDTNVDAFPGPIYRIQAHYTEPPPFAKIHEASVEVVRKTILSVTSKQETNGYTVTVLHPPFHVRYLLLVRDINDKQWRASGYFVTSTNGNPMHLHVDKKGMMSVGQSPVTLPALKFLPDVVQPEFTAGYGEDSDGDCLPDIYEVLVTHTDPANEDTGDTGVADGFKKMTSDGLCNLEKFLYRVDPLQPIQPPATVELIRPTGKEIWEAMTPKSDLKCELQIEVRTNTATGYQPIEQVPQLFGKIANFREVNGRKDSDVRISWRFSDDFLNEHSNGGYPQEYAAVQPLAEKVNIELFNEFKASLEANPPLSPVELSNRTMEIMSSYRRGEMDKGVTMVEMMLLENFKPQDFYGKVIDRDGKPLKDVSANAEITLNDGSYGETNRKKYSTSTGSNGLFEFTGLHGASLGVTISKPGYENEWRNDAYKGPDGGRSTPTDRTIYRMWSTNIHEALITGTKKFEIVPDGRPYFISLKNGVISEQESGDLKVWVQYTNQVVQGRLYDWSAGIEVINGGLWEAPRVYNGFVDLGYVPMFTAPANGYVPSFSYKAQIKGGQSGEIGNRFFYLLLNGGKEYGKMGIDLYAPYGRLHPGLICISYAINPSGSRILR